MKALDLYRTVLAVVEGDFRAWPEEAERLAKDWPEQPIEEATRLLARYVVEFAQERGLPVEQLAHESVPFLAGLLQWQRHGRPHFALAPDFFAALAVTDAVPADDPEPLKLPFHAFTLAFPKSPLLGNATRAFVYRLPRIVGLENPATFPLWRATIYPEGAEAIFTQWDDNFPRGQLVTVDGNQLDAVPPGARGLTEVEESIPRALRRLLVNVTCYIESTGELPRRCPPKGAKPAPVELVREGRSTWDVGRSIKLDGGIRRALAASASGTGTSWKLAQRFIVRGHWRNQAYGEARALRRRQWIEPFWKGPENVEEALQRTYEVGP